MSRFVVAAWCILAAAMCVAGQTAAPTPIPTPPRSLVWEDLFTPPYSGLPEIALGLSCVDPTLCYLPGGSNGAGFGVFSFDGQPNGYLNQMNEPNMTMMIMTIVAGGTKSAPVSSFAGFGTVLIKSPPYQYLQNGTTWLPSAIDQLYFIIASTAMSATKGANHVVAIGAGTSGNAIYYSNNGGASFVPRPFTIPLLSPNCSAPGFISMIDKDNWFMTLGSYPSDNSNSNSGSGSGGSSSFGGEETILHRQGFVVTVRTAGGKIQRRVQRPASFHKSSDNNCPYTGQIAKTTDGGKTWTTLFNITGINIGSIDCVSATHCVAVGYGETQEGESINAAYLTTDGKTFKQVYTLTGGYSMQVVKFIDANEAWIGGGFETQTSSAGAFWYTKDGGKTWKQYSELQPNLVMIMALDFVKGVGFALGMTELKTATILRYKKQHFDGYFVQSDCPFAGCTVLCQQMSFPQGMCIEAQGGSVQAFCDDNQIISQNYQTTSCIGDFQVSTMPINVCLNNTNGGFFENLCPSSPPGQLVTSKKAKRFHRN